jgi:hypothetical protein
MQARIRGDRWIYSALESAYDPRVVFRLGFISDQLRSDAWTGSSVKFMYVNVVAHWHGTLRLVRSDDERAKIVDRTIN